VQPPGALPGVRRHPAALARPGTGDARGHRGHDLGGLTPPGAGMRRLRSSCPGIFSWPAAAGTLPRAAGRVSAKKARKPRGCGRGGHLRMDTRQGIQPADFHDHERIAPHSDKKPPPGTKSSPSCDTGEVVCGLNPKFRGLIPRPPSPADAGFASGIPARPRDAAGDWPDRPKCVLCSICQTQAWRRERGGQGTDLTQEISLVLFIS